jgi:hypothetical protein
MRRARPSRRLQHKPLHTPSTIRCRVFFEAVVSTFTIRCRMFFEAVVSTFTIRCRMFFEAVVCSSIFRLPYVMSFSECVVPVEAVAYNTSRCTYFPPSDAVCFSKPFCFIFKKTYQCNILKVAFEYLLPCYASPW